MYRRAHAAALINNSTSNISNNNNSNTYYNAINSNNSNAHTLATIKDDPLVIWQNKNNQSVGQNYDPSPLIQDTSTSLSLDLSFVGGWTDDDFNVVPVIQDGHNSDPSTDRSLTSTVYASAGGGSLSLYDATTAYDAPLLPPVYNTTTNPPLYTTTTSNPPLYNTSPRHHRYRSTSDSSSALDSMQETMQGSMLGSSSTSIQGSALTSHDDDDETEEEGQNSDRLSEDVDEFDFDRPHTFVHFIADCTIGTTTTNNQYITPPSTEPRYTNYNHNNNNNMYNNKRMKFSHDTYTTNTNAVVPFPATHTTTTPAAADMTETLKYSGPETENRLASRNNKTTKRSYEHYTTIYDTTHSTNNNNNPINTNVYSTEVSNNLDLAIPETDTYDFYDFPNLIG